MKGLWRRWLGLLLLLLLHLSQSDARTQPLKHRRATNVAAKSEQSNRAVRQPIVAGKDTGAQGLRKNTRLKARRRRAHNVGEVDMPQNPQARRNRRRQAGEKLALQAGEEGADPAVSAKGTKKKKKKKKSSGKKTMSKEEAIAAAQEAQAAAAAALLKGISHEDAAKAAQATLNEKGATELTKGVLGAEDVEKAEGRPAPFKKKEAGEEAATTEKAAGAADAAAAPAKKKKKKKKAATMDASGAAAKADDVKDNADKSIAKLESDLSANSQPAAAAEEPVKLAPKKKKKQKKSKKAAADVSDRQLRTLDSNGTMLTQQGGEVTPYVAKDDVDDEADEDNFEDEMEEEEFELSMTGSDEAEESAKVAAASSGAGPKHAATPAAGAGAASEPSAGQEKSSVHQPAAVESSPAAQAAQETSTPPVAAEERQPLPPAALALEAAAAPSPTQRPAKAARPWFPLPEKREVSEDVLSSLINASAAAVKRDAAEFASKLRKHVGLHVTNATVEDSGAHRHHGASVEDSEESEALLHGKRGEDEVQEAAPRKEAVKAEEEEGPGLPEVKKLPPWFKDTAEPKDRAAKVGTTQRHKSRAKALGAEEKWLRAHQRHLHEVREEYDVIFYGDDIVEAWRGTFVGQKYGPFNDIPAVWEQFFGSKGYKALAAGIAGDGVEQLLWRLQNGELPPIVPPKVIVIACGTNSKGMSGECAVPAAEETAAQMREVLEYVRGALPAARIVALAPLPKGDYWPNRCTPAFDLFNANLQAVAAEHPQHVHYEDYGAAFLTKHAAAVWASNASAPVRQEINEMFMPDALHPSAAGMRVIAGKLEALVSRLVAEAEGAAQSA